ncbi:MAG: hypothetical protein ACR2PQ_00410, partial [Myxococcota bacterium]
KRHGVYQLACPVASIEVVDVLDALRGPREAPLGDRDVAERVDAVLDEIDRQRREELEVSTLEDLLLEPAVDPGGSGQ